MEDRDNKLYDEWRFHKEEHYKASFYSEKRFDTLIITLSGGAIYVVLNLIYKLKDKEDLIENKCFLFVVALFLIASILANLIGQRLSQKANQKEKDYAVKKLDEMRGEHVAEQELAKLDCSIQCLSKIINTCNCFSMVSTILAIIMLVIFYFFFLLG